MFFNTKIVSVAVFLFMMLSCSNSDRSTIKGEVEGSKNEIIEKKQTVEETFLQEIGFDFKGDKVIIDFNKTNNFFLSVERKLDEKAKEIEKKIQNRDINVTRDSGVVVSEDRVSIDLNSTKNLLNDIFKLFEDIILDINRTIN